MVKRDCLSKETERHFCFMGHFLNTRKSRTALLILISYTNNYKSVCTIMYPGRSGPIHNPWPEWCKSDFKVNTRETILFLMRKCLQIACSARPEQMLSFKCNNLLTSRMQDRG